MPPNVQNVPTLLLPRQGYRVILGEDIIDYFHIDANKETKLKKNLLESQEPIGSCLMKSNGGVTILSESYTNYNLTPEELSAKGIGGRRPMHNYVSANEEIISINTPADTYQPDKIGKDVTVNNLQQRRIDEIDSSGSQNSFI